MTEWLAVKVCKLDHVEIFFYGNECPLCKVVAEKEQQIAELDVKLEVLTEELATANRIIDECGIQG